MSSVSGWPRICSRTSKRRTASSSPRWSLCSRHPSRGPCTASSCGRNMPNMARTMPWMVVRLTPETRGQLVAALHKGAPPEVFRAMSGVLKGGLRGRVDGSGSAGPAARGLSRRREQDEGRRPRGFPAFLWRAGTALEPIATAARSALPLGSVGDGSSASVAHCRNSSPEFRACDQRGAT